jgi:hypothetical protein
VSVVDVPVIGSGGQMMTSMSSYMAVSAPSSSFKFNSLVEIGDSTYLATTIGISIGHFLSFDVTFGTLCLGTIKLSRSWYCSKRAFSEFEPYLLWAIIYGSTSKRD